MTARTGYLIELALFITDEAMRAASAVPGWQGRSAYHLLAGCTGYLKTASTLFRYVESTSGSTLHYAAEKFGRALRDTGYGLDEAVQNCQMPALFIRVRDVQHQLEEE